MPIRLEPDHAPLRKIKHIPRRGLHAFPRRIRDRPAALDDDLHLVVIIRVFELLALFEAVQAAGDGLFRVVLVGAPDVAEEVVRVRDQGWGEFRGGGRVVRHWDRGVGGAHNVWVGGVGAADGLVGW